MAEGAGSRRGKGRVLRGGGSGDAVPSAGSQVEGYVLVPRSVLLEVYERLEELERHLTPVGGGRGERED